MITILKSGPVNGKKVEVKGFTEIIYVPRPIDIVSNLL